jgi:hypothetical protein
VVAGTLRRVDRQQEALNLAEGLLTDIEFSETSTSKRVMKAMRLARLMRDDAAQEWLGFEVNGGPGNEAGTKWMTRTRRWTNQEEKKGWWSPAASIEAVRNSSQDALKTLGGSLSLSGDSINVPMRDRHNLIISYTKNATETEQVLSAIDAQLYQYAANVYAELRFSEIQASLFEQSRVAVDATLATMAGDALKKIESVNERLQSDDAEAISQAMSTCRRLIDSVADHVFPARDEPYDLSGQSLNVKKNAVLNRINAYLHMNGVGGSRATRLRQSLSGIYERVSAGVHADVDSHEARYLFLSTYVLLGEVLSLPAASTS